MLVYHDKKTINNTSNRNSNKKLFQNVSNITYINHALS